MLYSLLLNILVLKLLGSGTINTIFSRKPTTLHKIPSVEMKDRFQLYLAIVAVKYSNVPCRRSTISVSVQTYMPDCNSFAGCNCDNLVWSGTEHIKGNRSISVLLKGKKTKRVAVTLKQIFKKQLSPMF